MTTHFTSAAFSKSRRVSPLLITGNPWLTAADTGIKKRVRDHFDLTLFPGIDRESFLTSDSVPLLFGAGSVPGRHPEAW